MNYLAHHFVITTMNNCFDLCSSSSCDDAPKAPLMFLRDAVIRLYIGYRQIERAQSDEYLEAEEHARVHEASRALLYYVANRSSAADLITEVYETLDEFDEQANRYAEKLTRQRRRTFVIDNRTTTTNGETS